MDGQTARRVFEQRLRQGGASAASVVERTGRTLRETSPDAGGWAAVVWSDLDASTADEQIAEEIRHFARQGRRFEWKVYDGDQPDDLPDRLQRNGFTPEEPEALMIADIDELDVTNAPPDGVRIVEVRDAEELAWFGRAVGEAYDQDVIAFSAEIRQQQELAPDRLSVVVAMAGDRPVCGARTEFHPGTGFASLWGGGTVPDWRRRGVYRATVAHRARVARERGFRYLRVDALPTSEPILARLGFVRAGTTTPYRSPGG